MKRFVPIVGALVLSGCDLAQRAVQSATGNGPAASCASPETYKALNQVILDGIWPADMPRAQRTAYRDIDEMMRVVKFEQPVLDAVDTTTGSIRCSAQLVVRSIPILQFAEFPVELHVKAQRDRILVPIHYELVRTADTAQRVVRLEKEEALADFVLRYGKAADIEIEAQPEIAPDTPAGAAPLAPAINEQEAPIDTRDEELGENHL